MLPLSTCVFKEVLYQGCENIWKAFNLLPVCVNFDFFTPDMKMPFSADCR